MSSYMLIYIVSECIHVFPFGEKDEDANIQEDLEKHLQGGRNYFYVELPEGTILAHVLDAKESLPMQFGREVCGSFYLFWMNLIM
jgi:hypothetical protein